MATMPEMTVEQQLASTSPQGLLTTAYALTHRLHALEALAARAKAAGQGAIQAEAEAETGDVRARRDAVSAELLRRMAAADTTEEG